MSLRPCQECQKEISSDAKVCPNCGKQQSTGSNNGCLAIVIVIVVLSVLGGIMSHDSSDSAKSTPDSTTAVSPEVQVKQDALSKIDLEFRWSKDEMNIMTANFVVKNESSYNIKDLEITCEHFANSGSKIDSNVRTIYERVMAHTTRKFNNFNMGFIHSQAASSNCKITDLTVLPYP